MRSIAQKKKLLRDSRLYVILDEGVCGNERKIINIASQIQKAGVDIVQLRYKAQRISEFVRLAMKLRLAINKKKVLFIVNDRVDVALACNADGVHLGQDDLPPSVARRLLGKERIIGLSCHSLKQAKAAQRDSNVDYLSIGPVFSTTLKPNCKPVGSNIIPKINIQVSKPFFSIGGVGLDNLKGMLKIGAKRICLCRDICTNRNIYKRTKAIKEVIRN